MSVQIRRSAQGQAMPRETVPMPPEAFGPSEKTMVWWLGNAGFLLNSLRTTILCDPLLVGFDMPVLVEPPILPADVPAFDALLYTHIDNDHFARQTLAGIKERAGEVHATHYVAQVARDEEHVTDAIGHDIGERFCVGCVDVTLTPTWHNWQQHMRDEWVIATKYSPRSKAQVEPNVSGAEWIRACIDNSLRHLGVNTIDLYYMHSWDYVTPIEQSLEALNEAVVAGKLRALGVSDCHPYQLAKANALAEARGWARFEEPYVPHALAGVTAQNHRWPLSHSRYPAITSADLMSGFLPME